MTQRIKANPHQSGQDRSWPKTGEGKELDRDRDLLSQLTTSEMGHDAIRPRQLGDIKFETLKTHYIA
jgi:hypothetical protein